MVPDTALPPFWVIVYLLPVCWRTAPFQASSALPSLLIDSTTHLPSSRSSSSAAAGAASASSTKVGIAVARMGSLLGGAGYRMAGERGRPGHARPWGHAHHQLD